MKSTIKILLPAALVMLGVQAQAFEASSPSIAPGKTIAMKFVSNTFGCTGANVSPAINWKGAPKDTKSFAIMVHDPDAPTGGAGFWHFVEINIPATATGIAEGAATADGKNMPAGSMGVNSDYGAPGYGGPCPPVGDKPHHYNFTVYALKVAKIDLPPNATASLAGFMVNGNALAKSTFTGRFGRK